MWPLQNRLQHRSILRNVGDYFFYSVTRVHTIAETLLSRLKMSETERSVGNSWYYSMNDGESSKFIADRYIIDGFRSYIFLKIFFLLFNVIASQRVQVVPSYCDSPIRLLTVLSCVLIDWEPTPTSLRNGRQIVFYFVTNRNSIIS